MTKETFLSRLKERVLLFDGAMGTLLNARGLPLSRCKDELNLVNPDMVSGIHREYVEAGAEVIETNTFGANRIKLERYELEGKLRDINLRGVELAQKAATDGTLVAGSVGPLGALLAPYGPLSIEEVKELYREQIAVLVEGGVDLLSIESMPSVLECIEAVEAAREAAPDMPIVANLTFTQDGTTQFGTTVTEGFNKLRESGADVLGLNCTIGPSETYELIKQIDTGKLQKPMLVMPNAGYPTQVGNTFVYMASPDYFKEYATLFIEHGANLVGGCCGTTPDHIRAMADAVKGQKPRTARAEKELVTEMPWVSARREKPDVEPSRFLEKLGKEFVSTVEITPPKGADCTHMIDAAHMLKDAGVDAVDITDNPLARVRMSSIALAHILKRETGMEPILHYTCRDKNILAIQSDLIGAAALDLRCILAITGDPLSVGDYPDAQAVFEVNSTGLVKIINQLNSGVDLAGNEIGTPTAYSIAVGINPAAKDWDFERKKIRDKIEGGAAFAMTQPFYEVSLVETFVHRMEEFPELPVLVGILPLRTYRHAKFLHEEVPGITIPDPIVKRMEASSQKGDKKFEIEEGTKIATELYKGMRAAGVKGVYLIPPFEKYNMVVDIVKA